MQTLRTEHKSITFLVLPGERGAVLDVLHMMPHWHVQEILNEEGLSLYFSYGKKEDNDVE